jgi:AAA+ superfamily predicted ATPase
MEQLFTYLAQFIAARFSGQLDNLDNLTIPEMEVNGDATPLMNYMEQHQLSPAEVIILLMALAPHANPSFYSELVNELIPSGGDLPMFGGIKGRNHRGILPTGETILFVLGGNSYTERMKAKRYFHPDATLVHLGAIHFEALPLGEPKMSGRIILDEELIELFTTGMVIRPLLSQDFPAQRITTGMEWSDLVLRKKTFDEIQEIEHWLKYNEVLMNEWNMKHILKPGYRVMFYGPPGTGKTLTASLLGKYTGRDVYRIDLSMVVSKYIGETEKNLSNLFNKAANKDWILFFDEADAIFGKRTNVRDAHDKYANQEVSYLLQRIESHPGLVILASNLKDNIDAAFTRRFQSIIEFDLPNKEERIVLWRNNLPKGLPLDESISFEEISGAYDISGANIVNVIQYACLKQLSTNSDVLMKEHIIAGIRKEYIKEGRII